MDQYVPGCSIEATYHPEPVLPSITSLQNRANDSPRRDDRKYPERRFPAPPREKGRAQYNAQNRRATPKSDGFLTCKHVAKEPKQHTSNPKDNHAQQECSHSLLGPYSE